MVKKKPKAAKAAKKKVAPKKVAPKKKVVAKKPAPKKAAPAPKKVSKPVAPKIAAKPILKKPEPKKIELRRNSQEDKPAPVPLTKAQERKIELARKKPYKMEVTKEVLPRLKPHTVPVAGRIPSVAQQFSKEIAVSKVEDGRVYLIDEESASTYVPSLIEMQIQSYHWFLSEGLKELLEEISPITDFSGKKMELRILGHTFDAPKYDPETCKRRNLSFEAAMKGHVQLINKETGEIKELEQEIQRL
jgi:hypothetical protein